jgi:hypothetical protein
VFFDRACEALSDESAVRVAHSLETLSIVCRALFRKKFNNFAYDVVSIMCGIHQAGSFLPKLFNAVQTVLLTAPRTSILPPMMTLLPACVTDFFLSLSPPSSSCSGESKVEIVRGGISDDYLDSDGQY